MTYSIKDVCFKTGLSAHTLRYYEKEGLLTDIRRTKGGIRCYTEEDLETLELICSLKSTGMPLAEIAHFISLTREGEHTLRERCNILLDHKARVLSQIREMQNHLEKVTGKIRFFQDRLDEFEQRERSFGHVDRR